jgi:di/tricarboxylate transporter
MEASQAERKTFVDLGRLQRAEYFGFVAAIVLAVSLFLPWFSVDEQSNGTINGVKGELDAWETYAILDVLLLAACLAPFILAYIIVRRHSLGWRPGEVTAIVGLTAFVLIFCNGIVFGKPGEPDSEISFGIGWLIGLLAAGGIAISGFLRQLEGTIRKPPGV